MSEIVSIQGKGTVSSPYENATFTAIVRGQAATGPDAKERTREVSTRLFDALTGLREKGVKFRDDELRTKFEVGPRNEYNNTTGQREFKGYQATFTLTVTTDDIESVGQIHDALTSVNGAEVHSPSLNISPERRRNLKAEAFKAAVEVAQHKFEEQCEVLGQNPKDFQLVNWREAHDDFRAAGGGKFAALAKCADDAAGGPLEFHAGVAKVELSLNLDYERITRSA